VSTKVDHSLDTLLDLDGQQYALDDGGDYWVKFEAKRCQPSASNPHGVSYSLTLHGPGNVRLAGFDNAHPVRRSKGPSGKSKISDHVHHFRTVRSYDYKDAGTLVEDFWKLVERILKTRGVELW
jgi:hypothetical protein